VSRRNYQRGAARPSLGSPAVVRYAADEVEAYHALKHIESKAVRERKA
jgi:hypothetical protein